MSAIRTYNPVRRARPTRFRDAAGSTRPYTYGVRARAAASCPSPPNCPLLIAQPKFLTRRFVNAVYRFIKLVIACFVLGLVLLACRFNKRSQDANSTTDILFNCSCDSTLYQTIYDFIEENDSVAKIEKINILDVYDNRREGVVWIDLVAAPAYSHQLWTDDSVIVTHTIIHDWMINLILSPEVFNKYNASFTFVDPNQFPKYQKHYEGSFEPVSWRYILRNDSLVFVKSVRH